MSSFYDSPGLNVETYDQRSDLAGTPVEGDVAFYIDLAKDADGPVLEAACGTGRIVLPLARAGFHVVGADLSESMLEVARRSLRSEPPEVADRVSLVRQDMRALSLDQRFALVLVPFRAFQHLLTIDCQKRALAAFRAHLEPRGRLVIDIFDPRLDWCVPGGGNAPLDRRPAVCPNTGNAIEVRVAERRCDPVRQMLGEEWVFTERDATGRVVREERKTLEMRWTYRHEMRHLLELGGFDVVAEYSDFRRSPPAYGREQVWVARRRTSDS